MADTASSCASTAYTCSTTFDTPTYSCSVSPLSSCNPSRPSIKYTYTDLDHARLNISPSTTFYPRTSTETYLSEESDLDEEQDFEPIDPLWDVPEYRDVVESHLRASDPMEFAKLFPSTKRLYIRHDDTTYDGNMNLRIDTETKHGAVQLFHLRMQDLKKREFSLRRYERSSGREVCHSTQTFAKRATESRPSLSRSMSSALANMVMKPEYRRKSSGPVQPRYERKDSGYGTADEDDEVPVVRKESPPTPSCASVVRLEFSNYAQVDIKRRKSRASRRYEFEYWGRSYVWKKVVEKHGHSQAVSFHLYRADGGSAVAHIVPETQTAAQVAYDLNANNWVPPCTMWISDLKILGAVTDVAEIIVATGLMALVDDCIHSRFVTKRAGSVGAGRHSKTQTPDLKVDISTRALMSSMFRRRESSDSNKSREQSKASSPLRHYRFMEAC